MKKLYIIVFILLSSFSTNAVHLSSNGTGQVLIFPYYTVNFIGINTIINLTNTTSEPKALRVRFREAANSKEVFAFNLYLGANDVWTGALVYVLFNAIDATVVRLITYDNSCSVPNLSSNNEFQSDNFIGNNEDGYLNNFREFEGFIEVIEMGVLTGDSADATIINQTTNPNCQKFYDAWDVNSSDSYWLTDTNTDMLPPTGGIIGEVVLIDVSQGIAVTEDATVLEDFSDEIIHYSVEDESPTLADGNKTSIVVDSNGEQFSKSWDTGFQAVSSVLMKTTISNDFLIDDALGADTDIVLTMPTRQFHVNDSSNLSPFTEAHTDEPNCEPFAIENIFNGEAMAREPLGANPPPPIVPHLCYSTSVTNISNIGETYNHSQGIFSTSFPITDHANVNSSGFNIYPVADNNGNTFDSGWVNLRFGQVFTNTNDDALIHGLPLIGFSIQKAANGSLNGGSVLANYASIYNHKSTTIIEVDNNIDTLTGMSVGKDNIGQVLLYPYYSIRNDFNSILSVVNTTGKVKALRVRFLEGKNSRDVLNFNLYLKPYDVWSGGLVTAESTIENHIGEPTVKLVTHDVSCSVPAIINGVEFFPYGYDPFDNGDTSFGYDGLGTSLDRVLEGTIEITEMGELVGDDALHITEFPTNCAAIEANWQGAGKWMINPGDNVVMTDNKGGIMGSLQLINVEDGINMAYDAVAIQNYSSQVQHTMPSSLTPNLSTGNNLTTLIDTENGILQTTWDSPIDAVSALFMQESVSNDFAIIESMGAQTDMIVTYPTKQFYVDPMFANQPPLWPFYNALSPDIGACERHRFKAFNREQKSNRHSMAFPGVLPPTVSPEQNCWSVNMFNIIKQEQNISDTIFMSNLFIDSTFIDYNYFSNVEMPFSEGWMSVDFVDEASYLYLQGVGANGEIHKIYGKPVIGFVAQKYVNGTLDDGQGGTVLANYAVINMNKSKRKIVIE